MFYIKEKINRKNEKNKIIKTLKNRTKKLKMKK